jgi:hypothetical protein
MPELFFQKPASNPIRPRKLPRRSGTHGISCRVSKPTPLCPPWSAPSPSGILETAQRADIDARKLRDDAIAHIRNSPLWPNPHPGA